MARGYLVVLGDAQLGTGDTIVGPTTGFNEAATIGTGSWTWTGTYANNGQNYSNINDGGTYYQGTDGNVYFVPNNWYVSDVESASATAAPTFDARDFGTGGGDTILTGGDDDDVYGGATTSAAGTGADTIRTGAGSDTVYGGDGADRIEGGGDADTIYGGTGNDTIHGDDATRPESSDETLRWSGQGADGTNIIAGFTQDTGDMSVTVDFQNDGGNTGVTLSEGTQYTNGDGTDANSGVQFTGGAGPNVTTTLVFDANDGTGLSDEVTDVRFRISDVDTGGWQDIVTVRAWDTDGNEVAVTLTPAGNDTVSGQTVTSGPGSDSAADANGSVLVTIDGPVHSVQVIYSNGGNVGQALWLTDVDFTTVVPPEGDDVIDGGAGNDTIFGEGGDDRILYGTGNDTVYGGAGDDTIDDAPGTGGATTDRNSLYGGAGSDTIFGAQDADLLDGGTGDDRLSAEGGNDTLYGRDGDDVLFGGAGNDTAYGGTGNDDVRLGSGNDVFGGPDTEAGNDTIRGEDGNDSIHAGAGDDSVFGGSGRDTLTGGTGSDSVYGGTGSDAILVGPADGADTIEGGEDADGSDIDRLVLGDGGGTPGVTVTMAGDEAGSYAYGGGNASGDFVEIERVETGAGADTIDGSASGAGMQYATGAGDDSVTGGAGDDRIETGTGDDSIAGGDGNDTIIAGDGADTIRGGAGDDDIDLGVAGTPDGDPDRLILRDGDDADTIRGFDLPTANGDGTYTGIDRYDVTGMLNGAGDQVTVADVSVTDDGGGNAVLTFPSGVTQTLIGVSTADLSDDRVLVAMGIPPAPPDFTVEGTAGDDRIDTNYGNDPEGDRVDANDAADGSNDDLIEGYGGNDLIYGDGNGGGGGTGNDTIYGGDGDDTVIGEGGDDTLFGDAGDDFLNGVEGDDTLYGGAGNDSVEAGTGNDTVFGGAADDSLNGDRGDDTVYGGDGDDYIRGSFGNDTVYGGLGDDYVWGGFGDDIHVVENDFGNDTYFGDSQQEVNGDILDLSAVTDDLRIDLTNGDAESGSFTDGTYTATFSEIENVTLGAGTDTIVLADNSGSDAVTGFAAPTDNGDGTFTGRDQLDVTGLTSDFGTTPVYTGDVTVTDDGNGNAVLTFPGGENLTLIGVSPSDVDSPRALEAMGIPIGDGTVTGTSGADLIDDAYDGDDDGDRVDNGDAILAGDSGDDDLIFGLGGADTIRAGDGADEVYGGSGNDSIDGGTGDDTLFGDDGEDTLTDTGGDDTLFGGAGDDTFRTGAGNDTMAGGTGDDTFVVRDGSGTDTITGGENTGDRDTVDFGETTDADGVTVTFTGDEAATIDVGGAGTTGTFTEIEAVRGSDFGDTVDASADDAGVDVDGGDGDDTLTGGTGGDTLTGGAGDDTLTGGLGADTIFGGDGDDAITFAEGDTVFGGTGDDDFYLSSLGQDGLGNLTAVGGEGGETRGDTLHLGTGADLSSIVYTTNTPDEKSGSVTLDDGRTLFFSNMEQIICFTPGARIATPRGARAVETLATGDMVVTRDHGLQAIRWIGTRTVAAEGRLAPVRIRPGVVTGQERDLLVSPQHRMLFTGHRAELLFGESEVLVPATHLVDGIAVTREPGGTVTYVHVMFDQHEVIYAEGAATESFHPGDLALDAIREEGREELFTIFPELRAMPEGYGGTARKVLKRHESGLLRV